MKDYVYLVSKYYTGYDIFTIGDPSNYNNINWGSSTPILQSELDIKFLDECKEIKKKDVNSYRDMNLYNGFTDANNIRWSTSPVDIQNLNAICTLISLGVVTNAQVWRDADNVNHTLQPSDFVVLAGALATFVATCYQVSWVHKANVDALTTDTDIFSYDYSTNWPS